jgi:hypothetical protein
VQGGYRLQPERKADTVLALKKLDQPFTAKAVLKASVRSLPGQEAGRSMLRNGYLVLGGSADPADLVYGGLRWAAGKLRIAEGPLRGGQAVEESFALDLDKSCELALTVDLAAAKAVLTAGGKTIQLPLKRPLKAITHAGYATDNAVAEFTTMEISGE